MSMPLPGLGPTGPVISLRDYQRAAINAIGSARDRGVRRQLVVLPTGSGKTVIFAHLAAVDPGRVLILVHRDELVRQTVAKLLMVDPDLDVGVVKAARDEHDRRVVVASVQTLSRASRLDRVTADFGLIIVDEAHHAVADSYVRVLAAMGCPLGDEDQADDDAGPLTVGFTATAGRGDKAALGQVWQEITYQRGILQMIAEGYLVDVAALGITADMDMGRVQVARGDYTDASLGAELERGHALEAAALAYARHASGRRGVAFTPTVATSEELARHLNAQGIRAEHLDGTTDPVERRAILGRLAAGETQVVSNCMVLTEGWDEPSVSCMLNCRPTRNRGLFIQMAGRILRTHPGKEDALIIDVAGAAPMGLATVADLAGLPAGAVTDGETLTDAAGRILAEQKNRQAIAAIQAQQIELFRRSDLRWISSADTWLLPAGTNLTMALVPAGDPGLWNVYQLPRGAPPIVESARPMPLEWARGVGEEIARANGGVLSRADAAWRSRDATPQQARLLASLGYDVRGLDRGAAADQITTHFAARTLRKIRRSTHAR